VNQVYNVALGEQTSLNELFAILHQFLGERVSGHIASPAVHEDFRPGDVRFSRADISKAQRLLGFRPTCRVQEGLERAVDWYLQRSGATAIPVTKTPPALVPTAGVGTGGISLVPERMGQPHG
jgi:UDP-N-acetylglucosamine 4-epimerase